MKAPNNHKQHNSPNTILCKQRPNKKVEMSKNMPGPKVDQNSAKNNNKIAHRMQSNHGKY